MTFQGQRQNKKQKVDKVANVSASPKAEVKKAYVVTTLSLRKKWGKKQLKREIFSKFEQAGGYIWDELSDKDKVTYDLWSLRYDIAHGYLQPAEVDAREKNLSRKRRKKTHAPGDEVCSEWCHNA